MVIAGLQRFSLIDFPGQVAAIVFTQGCYFRCPYCHNPELVLPEQFGPMIEEETVFDFLRARIGKLDGVVVTGGEPTMQNDLPKFIRRVKDLGMLVKLDSSGVRPDVLQTLFDAKLVDYVAMDIKAPLPKYEEVVQVRVELEAIRRSISLVMQSGVDYEFRTTLVEGLLTPDDVRAIGEDICGAKRYYLQKFVSTKAVDRSYLVRKSFDSGTLALLCLELLAKVGECEVR